MLNVLTYNFGNYLLAGSFFKEQLWNTLRFLIGLFLIVSVLEAQLQMRSMLHS